MLGVTHALERNDGVSKLHRRLGVFCSDATVLDLGRVDCFFGFDTSGWDRASETREHREELREGIGEGMASSLGPLGVARVRRGHEADEPCALDGCPSLC